MKSRIDWTMGFGGPWTTEKLGILEEYLDSYTTALKHQPFRLVYIDAFAGSGEINIGDGGVSEFDSDSFVAGSTERALRVDDRPLDQFVFVEKRADRCKQLLDFKMRYADRLIEVIQGDANAFLSGLGKSGFRNHPNPGGYRDWRGVLFVDPFGTALEWATVEHIADLERLDLWLLFPVGAIGRMLPLSKDPDEVQPEWAKRLNIVFGGDQWRQLYSLSPQQDLFIDAAVERDPGINGLLEIYKNQLERVFGARFLRQSRTLKNSKNSPLFEFIFCVGSSSMKAIQAAKRIARHFVRDLSAHPGRHRGFRGSVSPIRPATPQWAHPQARRPRASWGRRDESLWPDRPIV